MNRAIGWILGGLFTISPLVSAGPVTIPNDWQPVASFVGTPDFSDPHYRQAFTQVYRFIDPAGIERHAYVIVCAGDERSKDQPKPPPGETASTDQPQDDLAAQGDDRQHEAEEMSKVKAKRLKGAGLTMMTIGDSDDDDDIEDSDDDTPEGYHEEPR